MTQNELKLRLGVDSNAKSLNEILLARMLDAKGRIACTEEFQKAGIIPKTIRVQSNGKIKESMSFPTFDFIALSKEETWEESELYNYLAPTKFMFVIFQERGDGAYAPCSPSARHIRFVCGSCRSRYTVHALQCGEHLPCTDKPCRWW